MSAEKMPEFKLDRKEPEKPSDSKTDDRVNDASFEFPAGFRRYRFGVRNRALVSKIRGGGSWHEL